jgi:hypothetical protein
MWRFKGIVQNISQTNPEKLMAVELNLSMDMGANLVVASFSLIYDYLKYIKGFGL